MQNSSDVNYMDQKSIVLYLARKGFSPREISSDLESMLEREAVSYKFMTCYLREARCVSSNLPPLVFESEPKLDNYDEAILLTFSE
jgi:hypothetical protein